MPDAQPLLTSTTRTPRLSRVAATILALLIDRPSYGYEVWQRYQEMVGPIDQHRIYYYRDRLVRAGLIEEIEDLDRPTGRRQPRYFYRATAGGARVHRELLAQELRADPRLTDLHHRMVALGPNDAAGLLDVVGHIERLSIEQSAQAAHADPESLRDRVVAAYREEMLSAQLNFVARASRLLAGEATT